MKQLFFSLVLSFTLGVHAFAADTVVAPNILQSFQKTFSNAKEVVWSTGKDLYKAEFVYSSQYITAYYDADGTMLALTKNILSTQLPLLLENSLKENYCDYWIADIVEFSTEEGTSYYATLENADGKVVLKSSQNNWTVNKKIKK
jgi:hypothetical protein